MQRYHALRIIFFDFERFHTVSSVRQFLTSSILVETVGNTRVCPVIAMNCANVKQGSMLVLTFGSYGKCYTLSAQTFDISK